MADTYNLPKARSLDSSKPPYLVCSLLKCICLQAPFQCKRKWGEIAHQAVWLDLPRVILSMNIVGLIFSSGRFDLETVQRGVRGGEGWMAVLPLTIWVRFQTSVSSTYSTDNNINSTHPWDSCRDCCCCSVPKLCPTLCDPVDCSTPGLPVLHHLPEFAQVCVHWISDAMQTSHPLSPSSPSA